MSKIFLSHSSANNAAALALARWLEANGWGDFFLDVSTTRGLAPGERWQAALRAAADRCEAVVFLISPAWRESRWCLAEFLLAKQLGKALFGVMIEATPIESLPGEMTSEWQLCDLVGGTLRETFRVSLDPIVPETDVSFAVAGLARLRTGLQRAGLDAATFPWPPPDDLNRAPYRGLKALESSDAAVFFGRDAAIVRGLDKLRSLREGSVEQMLVILGASGAGKSSFLRAGLLPRLLRDDRHFLALPVIRPERAAISGRDGLVTSLDAAFRRLDAPRNRAEIRAALSETSGLPRLLAALQHLASRRLLSEKSLPTVVLSIDQGEELFGPEGRQEADQFLSCLSETLVPSRVDAATPPTPADGALAIIALRTDSYELVQTEPRFARVPALLFSLPPIPRAEFKAIIEGPAARASSSGRELRVDPELTEQLLHDTEGADALPLLGFTLERLFVELGGDGVLSLDDYKVLGGVSGSIEAAIEAAFADPNREPIVPATKEAREPLLDMAFVPWLARVDPETEERKRRVARWDEIPGPAQPLLERLIEQRLLVVDRRRIEEGGAETKVVEVAHEALLRRWPLLTAWLNRDGEALKAIDTARRAAGDWVKYDRGELWLVHTQDRLQAVEELLKRPDLERLLGSEGREYIRKCRNRDDAVQAAEAARQLEEAQQKGRRVEAEEAAAREKLRAARVERDLALQKERATKRISRLVVLAAIALVAVMLGGTCGVLQQRARAKSALAASDGMEALRRQRSGEAAQSLAYLARAVRNAPADPGWRAAIAGVLLSHQWATDRADLWQAGPGARGWGYSLLTLVSPNRWGIATADSSDPGPTTSVAISPDGKFVATVSGDEVRVWDAGTGAQIGKTLRHRNSVTSAMFDADSRLIATASRDRTVRLWDVRTGAALGVPFRHEASVASVALSAGGTRLITLSGDRVRVWEVGAGTEVNTPLSGLEAEMLEVGAGGKRAVTRSAEGMQIWNAHTGFSGGKSLPGEWEHAVFSKDGACVLTWGEDGWRLWDADEAIAVAHASESLARFSLQRAVMSDNRSHVAVLMSKRSRGDTDGPGVVHLWKVGAGNRMRGQWETSAAGDLQLCADGSRMLTLDGAVATLWETASGDLVGKPLPHRTTIAAAALSADCTRLVTAAGTDVRVWNARTAEPIGEAISHSGDVSAVRFVGDDTNVVTVSPAGARIWDTATTAATGSPLILGEQAGDEPVVSGDGQRVTVAFETELRTWNLPIQSPVEPALVGESITAKELSHDGRRLLVTSDDDRTGVTFARVWDVENAVALGRPLRLDGHKAIVTISGDGKMVLTATEKIARLWSADSGERVGTPLRHRGLILKAVFSKDGSLVATASEDGTARVWRVSTGEPVGQAMRHESVVSSVAFSADGKRLLTLANKIITADLSEPRTVRVWLTQTGAALCEPIQHDREVTSAELAPDGQHLVTTFGTVARLWDASTGKPVGEPMIHEQPVTFAQFSPDGNRIATVSEKNVQVWDAVRAIAIGRPLVHADRVSKASFVQAGQGLLTVSGGGNTDWSEPPPKPAQVLVWDAPVPEETEVELLAAAAEAVSGYTVTDLGAVVPIHDVAARLASLRTQLGSPAENESAGRSLVRWLLEDPRSRAVSPLAAMHDRVASVTRAGGARAHAPGN